MKDAELKVNKRAKPTFEYYLVFYSEISLGGDSPILPYLGPSLAILNVKNTIYIDVTIILNSSICNKTTFKKKIDLQ